MTVINTNVASLVAANSLAKEWTGHGPGDAEAVNR